jgi:hypothetical protein
MFIGIIYDVFSGESISARNEDLATVKQELIQSNLQLPIACIYDYSKNRFVLLNDSYKRHIEELLTTIEVNR